MGISVRKIFALLLAGMVCVSFTGCSNKDEIKIESPAAETTTSTAVVDDTGNEESVPAADDTSEEEEPPETEPVLYPYMPEEEFDIFPYFTQAVLCDMANPYDYYSHIWNDTVPVEGYFIDSDGNVANLDGETSWEVSGIVDEAMLRFDSLEAADFYQTCYVRDYVVDNGTLYHYGEDLLLVWNPPAERQDDPRLQDMEYDTDTYYLATVFYKRFEDSCPISLDMNDSIIWDGVKYTYLVCAGYWTDEDGNAHESFNNETDSMGSTVIADAMEQFRDLEYIGAFRDRSTTNGLVYENRMYRNGDELIILYKLYAIHAPSDEEKNMYNYSLVERWVPVGS